jgi:hypothetical protein
MNSNLYDILATRQEGMRATGRAILLDEQACTPGLYNNDPPG